MRAKIGTPRSACIGKSRSNIIEAIESNPPDILIVSELDSAIDEIKNFITLHQFLSNLAEKEYNLLPYNDAKLPLTEISLKIFLKN